MAEKSDSRLALTTVRVLLGLVLLGAGVTKLSDPSAFSENLANYQLIPQETLGLLALFVSCLEILVGISLLCGYQSHASGLLSATLFAGFAGFTASALLRNLQVSCGCFNNDWEVSWPHVGLNIVAVALSLKIAKSGGGAYTLDSRIRNALTQSSLLAAGAALALLNITTLLALGFPTLPSAVPPPSAEEVQVEFAPPVLDLGTVKQEDEIEVQTVLKNTGTRTARIAQVESTCSCTAAETEKPVLQPGESTSVKLRYKAGSNRGAIHQAVFVYIENMEDPVALDISGQIDPTAELQPGVVTLLPDAPQGVTLTNNRPNQELKITGFSCELDSVRLEIVEEKSHQILLEVSTSKPLPPPKNGATVWPLEVSLSTGPPVILYLRGSQEK